MIIQPKPPPELKEALLLRLLNTPPNGRNIGPNKKGIKMIIGSLNKQLKGKITTLQHSFNLKLDPNTSPKGEDSPTHIVRAVNSRGDVFQIGSAWERKITKGEKINQNMYSLAIDDPALESPLNVTAFPAPEGYHIVWERQNKVAKKEEF